MSWITVIWVMNAGAFLTLAAFAARLARVWETRERFNLAAKSANLEMWEWDLERDEICVAPTCRAQLGLPAFGRITFQHLMPRWHADDRDRVRQAVNEAIQNGKDCDVEFRVVPPDGRTRWVHAHGHMQLDDGGKPQRLTVISLDITDRKEAEIRARKQRDELEESDSRGPHCWRERSRSAPALSVR